MTEIECFEAYSVFQIVSIPLTLAEWKRSELTPGGIYEKRKPSINISVSKDLTILIVISKIDLHQIFLRTPTALSLFYASTSQKSNIEAIFN